MIHTYIKLSELNITRYFMCSRALEREKMPMYSYKNYDFEKS